MMKHLMIMIVTLSLLLSPTLAQAFGANGTGAIQKNAPPTDAMSTPQRIEAALAGGQIDQDTAHLYLAYALGDYRKLPAAYHSSQPWDGTLPLLHLQQAVADLPAGQARTEIEALLTGACSSSSGTMTNLTNTTHFHVQYNTIAGGLDINDYTASLETTWNTEIINFKWAAPPVLTSNPPPGNRYHVRIDDLGSGLYGYVSQSGAHAGYVGDNPNTTWNDQDAYASCMVLNEDYGSLGGQAGLDATTAHEFNHSIQFGYGGLSGSNTPDDAFVEGCATWMEDEVYDYANDNYNYLWPTFTMCMGEYTQSPYPYWITFRGLTERYGTGSASAGEQIMQDFWEETSKNSGDNLGALSTALTNVGGSLANGYHAYAIAVKFNKACGGGYVYPYCFEEGPAYVAAQGATSVQGSIAAIGGSYSGNLADNYALNWVSLPASGSYDVVLQNTSAGGQLRASVVCDTGSALRVEAMPAVVGGGASSRLPNFNATGCSSVVAVLTNQYQSANNPSSCTNRAYTLQVTAPSTPDFSLSVSPAGLDVCAPNEAVYTVTLGVQAAFSSPVSLSAVGHPSGSTASFSPNPATPPASSQLTIGNTGAASAGVYDIQVTGISGSVQHTATTQLRLSAGAPSAAPALAAPADGLTDTTFSPAFSWGDVPLATGYSIEIATDPYFSQVVAAASGLTTPAYTPSSALEPETAYYWRVQAANGCGQSGWSDTFSFATAPLICANVVGDGGFEAGRPNPSWSESSDVGLTLIQQDAANAHSGSWLAWLGDANGEDAQVWQTVAIPAGAISATLSYWYVIDSTDWCGYDDANLIINGATVASYDLCENENTTGYVQGALDMLAYAGTSPEIRFQVTTDGSYTSTFLLDDVSLVACTPGSSGGVNTSTLNGSYGIAWHTGDGAWRLGPVWNVADGVTRDANTAWLPGQPVTLHVNTNAAGYLAAWFDWNDNGQFDAWEHDLTYTISAAGNSDIMLTIPNSEGYAAGQTLRTRFRFYASEPLDAPQGSETFDGPGGNGEVEDYVWSYAPTAVSLRRLGTGSTPALGGLAVSLLMTLAVGWAWRRRKQG